MGKKVPERKTLTSLLSSANHGEEKEQHQEQEIQSYNKLSLNELQTILRACIKKQNYKKASIIKNIILNKSNKTKNISWSTLGTIPWLIERLDALEYIIPTIIQINAMECINNMLLQQQQKQQDN